MATHSKGKLGYEDYARNLPDGNRYEILDGELYVTPVPTPLHQRLSKRFERQLEDYFEARGLGEVFNAPIDLVIGRHDIAQPDLLVVEALSPSTRALDRSMKMRRYAELGIPHYWVLDPDAERLECLKLDANAYRVVAGASVPDTLSHPDWPDLTIDLAALWR